MGEVIYESAITLLSSFPACCQRAQFKAQLIQSFVTELLLPNLDLISRSFASSIPVQPFAETPACSSSNFFLSWGREVREGNSIVLASPCMHRKGMAGSGSFSSWMEKQNHPDSSPDSDEESVSLLAQLRSINDSIGTQLLELSGNLPDAPLNAAFRQRVQYAIYCLLGSIFFAVMAVFVGLPTLVLKPTKFVMCITLSTVLSFASVIILQKPSNFIQSLIEAGPMKALPIVSLFASFLFTLYSAIFVHSYRYIVVCFAAGIELTAILFYIASFIPGGTRGLQVLLKMAYVLISTALQPCIFMVKRTFNSFVSSLVS